MFSSALRPLFICRDRCTHFRTVKGEKIMMQTGWSDPYVIWTKKDEEQNEDEKNKN